MIERLFYGLPVLAKRWKRDVDDLMHMGIKGEAQIYHDLLGVGDRRWYAHNDSSFLFLEYQFEAPTPQAPEVYRCTPQSLRLIAKGKRFDFARYQGHPQSNLAYFCPPIKVEADDLCMLPAEVARLDEDFATKERPLPATRWPWGDYETELLRHLAAAAHEWWADFDPAEPSKAPTNDAVAAWLQDRGVSKRNADAMATILRAEAIQPGRRGN